MKIITYIQSLVTVALLLAISVTFATDASAPKKRKSYSTRKSKSSSTRRLFRENSTRKLTRKLLDFQFEKLGNDIDGEASNDRLGESVSLSADGKTMAVGATGNAENGDESGHVRVYRLSDTNNGWTQLGNDIDGEAGGDQSGYSISLSADGTVLAVGAPYHGDNLSGHVRVFRLEGNSWNQLGDNINGEAADDESGYSISLSGDGTVLAVGAPVNNGVNGTASGQVRVFKIPPSPSSLPSSSLAPSSGPSGMPSSVPSSIPSSMPSSGPSSLPSSSSVPSGMPSSVPSSIPSSMPSSGPSSLPSSGPSSLPSLASSFPSFSDENDFLDDGICFSPIATVSVNGKGRIMMKDLTNGDNVLTMNGSYLTMYSMNHYHTSKETTFVQIKTSQELEQPLELSPKHLLYLADNANPVPASTVEVGDKVWTLEGRKKVLEINMVTRNGLYNPLTMDGTIVVDGIAASVYTTPSGTAYLQMEGVWSKMMNSLSFHDALHMISAPYRQFCTVVSIDLCNLHEKESAASSFMKTFFFSFFSNQNDFVKFIFALSYVLIFGTLTNLTYFKVWVLLANASAFFTILSKMSRTKKTTAKTISA